MTSSQRRSRVVMKLLALLCYMTVAGKALSVAPPPATSTCSSSQAALVRTNRRRWLTRHNNDVTIRLRGGGDDSSPQQLFLSPDAIRLAETLAPKVGILTSSALYFAPAAAVLQAIRSDSIGELNPLPLAIMSVVSVSWLAYGLAARDIYVSLSNIAGCIGSIGYVVGILPLLTEKKQLRLTQGVVMAGAAAVLCLWTFLGVSGAPAAKISSSLGLFASGLFIILSGSPLSTIGKVVSTRNSASILGPLTMAQVTNTFLWSLYGLAVKDRFVWGPNVAGLALGLVQLALKIVFPSK